jgi:hypothetical protein
LDLTNFSLAMTLELSFLVSDSFVAEPTNGFEPSTPSLPRTCSTD